MNTELRRLPNENDNDVIIRICNAKDKHNWSEVCNTLNAILNKNCEESTYRKKFKKLTSANVTVKRHNENDNQDDNVADINDKLDEKLLAIKRERVKLSTEKAEWNKQLRTNTRQELFYENVAKNIQVLPCPEFTLDTNCCLDDDENNVEYILTIADVHLGSNFVSEHNEYSIDICKQRFEHLYREMVSFVYDKDLSHINIVSLGDMIQGMIHLTDIKLNETTVVESVVIISKILAEFLNKLSRSCTIDYYHTPTANHTQLRPFDTKQSELPVADVEYIIGHYIKDALQNNERVNVHLAENGDCIQFNVNGYEIIALHGHTIKNINNSIKDLSCFYRKFYDICLLGHYHGTLETVGNETESTDTEILVSPSFIGSCPYSDKIKKGAKPACKIYGIDKDKCHTETYKICL